MTTPNPDKIKINKKPASAVEHFPSSQSSNSLDYNELLENMQESETVMKKPKVLMGRDLSIEDEIGRSHSANQVRCVVDIR